MSRSIDLIVAGHVCLDILPNFDAVPSDLGKILKPGQLLEVGAAVISPGGAVSNVGMVLSRLGLSPRLVGKVGDDLFGTALLQRLRRQDPQLVEGMIQVKGTDSSYTIVVSPPESDRLFFHYPGSNATFRPEEVPLEASAEARLLHFGYPPALRQTYLDGGQGLVQLFREARARDVAVSLDMTFPDPGSEAGQVDWENWFSEVLPHVDLFAPSLEELLFMMDRPTYETLVNESSAASFASQAGTRLLDRLSRSLIEYGVALVALKLGDQGLYLRTAEDSSVFQRLGVELGLDVNKWTDRQLLLPPFEAEVEGTTGAGDAAHAGLLAGLHQEMTPEAAVRGAVAVGTCNVEAPDATSGIPDWERIQARLQSGWEQRPLKMAHPGWTWKEEAGIWVGPQDSP